MSGTPSNAELQAQWKNIVDILETARVHADGTQFGAGGNVDVLIQSLEGEYTPEAVTAALSRLRANYAALVDPGTAAEFLTPILYDYGQILAAEASLGFGSAYRNPQDLARALYEYFVAKSYTVQSRDITFDTTATAGGSNVGNGAMSRLTVDENGFDLEACHVEKKTFRCRQDQNSGVEEEAEVFEGSGTQSSQDALLRLAFGSGATATIPSHHAGTGRGGSLLNNSSFSTYDAAASPKFSGWTESAGGSYIAQDTVNYYRSHPGAQTDASLKITGGSGTVTLKQTLANMRATRLDPDAPYFLRVMLNKTTGSASGGTVTIRMGSASASVTIAGMSANWTELLIAPASASWFRQFNVDPFDIEIEWSSSSSGYLLVDDVLFAPWDLFDGTYWFLRANAASPASWLVDDTLTFTDTGGTSGIIQHWWWVAGFGYLPSTTGTPTLADPT